MTDFLRKVVAEIDSSCQKYKKICEFWRQIERMYILRCNQIRRLWIIAISLNKKISYLHIIIIIADRRTITLRENILIQPRITVKYHINSDQFHFSLTNFMFSLIICQWILSEHKTPRKYFLNPSFYRKSLVFHLKFGRKSFNSLENFYSFLFSCNFLFQPNIVI